MPPHVLVLGGGYVPITLTRALRRSVARGELDVTVVSRDNFHTFHGFVGEMITGRIGPSSMLSPVRRIFAPAKVHVAEIESIDLDARKVVTSRHLDGARFELDYDHLVLCLGSSENLDAYPGLAEHAFKLKTFKDCLALKNHILEMFELADIERDPAERRRLLTFVVAGGGYAGTEIAGELADFVRLLTKREYSGIRRDECRVVIVHPGPTLLPELYGSQSAEGQGRGKGYAKLVEYATQALAQARRRAAARDSRRGRDAPRRLPLERRARADADDRQRRRHGGAAALRHDRDPAERAGPRAHGRMPARRGLRERVGRGRLRRRAAPRRRHLPAGRHLRAQARRADRQEPAPGRPGEASRSRSATRGSARACRSDAAPQSAS